MNEMSPFHRNRVIKCGVDAVCGALINPPLSHMRAGLGLNNS